MSNNATIAVIDQQDGVEGRISRDLTGMRFGKLLVVRFYGWIGPKRYYKGWECRCDCGNAVIARENVMVGGYKQSCGCFKHRFANAVAFKAISPNGMEYQAKSQFGFAKEHGLHQPEISRCLLGKIESHKGWRFEREDADDD